MNEKILIKSQHYSLATVFLIFFLLTVMASTAGFAKKYIHDINRAEQNVERRNEQHKKAIEGAKSDYEAVAYNACKHFSLDDYYDNDGAGFYSAHPTFESYASCIGLDLNWQDDTNVYIEALSDELIIPLVAPLTLNLLSLLVWLWQKSHSLTVTNKRVYANVKLGKRVDLPLDSITAIAIGLFKGISISTPSGRITLWFIKNRDEIHQMLMNLVLARQTKAGVQEEPTTSSCGDEDFVALDSDLVETVEFDEEERQILGL